MNSGRGILGLWVLLALALWGCRGDADTGDPEVSVRLGISPTPPLVGPTRMLVEIGERGTPTSEARVSIEGSMNHAGMVPVLDSATILDDGRYVVPAFDFNMAGDWIVEVRVELPDGRRLVRRFPVRVSGGVVPP